MNSTQSETRDTAGQIARLAGRRSQIAGQQARLREEGRQAKADRAEAIRQRALGSDDVLGSDKELSQIDKTLERVEREVDRLDEACAALDEEAARLRQVQQDELAADRRRRVAQLADTRAAALASLDAALNHVLEAEAKLQRVEDELRATAPNLSNWINELRERLGGLFAERTSHIHRLPGARHPGREPYVGAIVDLCGSAQNLVDAYARTSGR